jgi:hypothetical protein
MMKRKLLLLVGVLLVVSLACSALSFGGKDEAQEAPSADSAMDADAEDGEAVEDAPAADDADDVDDAGHAEDAEDVDGADHTEGDDVDDDLTYDSDGLDQLDSYRATISYEMTNADGIVQSFEFEQAATRDPAAQHLTMSSEEGDIEYIQIEDQMWIRFGEEWIQSSSDSAGTDDFGSILTGSADWMSDVDENDYEYLGKETVNGINTKHYQVTYSAGWIGILDEVDGDGDIDSGVADVWIANERDLPEFMARYRIELEGTLGGKEGSVTMAQDITEINEPVVIEAPEGVAMGGLPEGVPVYPDATDVTSFGDMSTFTVSDEVETVSDFYTDALTSAGWEKGGEGFTMETMVSSTWLKDGDELSLTITADDDGVVTVLVMVTPGE